MDINVTRRQAIAEAERMRLYAARLTALLIAHLQGKQRDLDAAGAGPNDRASLVVSEAALADVPKGAVLRWGLAHGPKGERYMTVSIGWLEGHGPKPTEPAQDG